MICVALVGMSDWPLDARREVDPTHPKIIGLLRGNYIAPLVVPGQRVHIPQTAPAASSPPADEVVEPKAATRSSGQRRPRASSKKKP